MIVKSDKWRKYLLAAGLIAVFIQGMVQLPEIRDKIFPGAYKEEKFSQIEREFLKTVKLTTELKGNLSFLSTFKPVGPITKNSVAPDLFTKVVYSPNFSWILWQDNLQQARKNYILADKKMKFIVSALNLLIVGPAPGEDQTPAIIRKQANNLLEACQTYRQELRELSNQLAKFNEIGNNGPTTMIKTQHHHK